MCAYGGWGGAGGPAVADPHHMSAPLPHCTPPPHPTPHPPTHIVAIQLKFLIPVGTPSRMQRSPALCPCHQHLRAAHPPHPPTPPTHLPLQNAAVAGTVEDQAVLACLADEGVEVAALRAAVNNFLAGPVVVVGGLVAIGDALWGVLGAEVSGQPRGSSSVTSWRCAGGERARAASSSGGLEGVRQLSPCRQRRA